MSTFILSYAHRVKVTPYDAAGVLQAAQSFNLQSTECTPDKELNDIDITNSESNGFAEFAPTYVVSMFNVNGIVDGILAFDALFSGAMDGKLMTKLDFYLSKPTATVLNPVIYTGTRCLCKKISITASPKEGAVKFTSQVRVVGQIIKTGTDLTTMQGFVIGF